MEINVGDILHCEEQLKTTLHCDDKEKLRMKLALLQREYLKTAQKLQRAERSEAVRRHVRSRIEQWNSQEQRDPEVTSNPELNTTTNGTASGQEDHDSSKKSQSIRFLLPPDAACPQTPDVHHDTAGGHRPSPALRLRSRRSRLRWERKSAEARRSVDNGEDRLDQSEASGICESEVRAKSEVEGEVLGGSEELFSGAESESPCLLLTHWNSSGQTEAGKNEEKETGRGKESEGGKESSSMLLDSESPVLRRDKRGKEGSQNRKKRAIEPEERRENSGKKTDGRLCEENSDKETKRHEAAKTDEESKLQKTPEIKEEKSELAVKGSGLLDSCTLVEGLLFPAEYYVRTTRRMSSSQSQPNMEAVINTQLNMGRPRRSRGRGRSRGSLQRTLSLEESDKNSATDFSSSSSVGPCVESPAAGTPAELKSLSSCGSSGQAVPAEAPTRRGRRRGRGRPQKPRCSLSSEKKEVDQQTPDDPQLTSSPALHEVKGPKPGEADPEPDLPEPAAIPSTTTQPPSSGGNGAQSRSAEEHPEKVYSVFLKSSSSRTDEPPQTSRGASNLQSLSLPSSSPAQTPLLPPPSLLPGPLVNHLFNADFPQDFHLPDDQFASLKLHKLCRVSAGSGVEDLTPAPHSPVKPLPVQLSLTPVITESPHPAAAQNKDPENLSTERPSVQEDSREKEVLQPDCETHTSLAESASEDQVDNQTHKPPKPLPGSNSEVDHHVPSEKLEIKESSIISPEDPTGGPGGSDPSEDQRRRTDTDEDVVKSLSFDSPQRKTCEDPSRSGPHQSPVPDLKVKAAVSPRGSSGHTTSPPRDPRADTQLLLSPLLASAPGRFTAPHLRPSFVDSSPPLPSLGPTPHPVFSSSPSAPALTLPPPHSPSTQNLPPPALSPCMSPTLLPPSPAALIQVSSGPAPCVQDQVGVRIEETAGEQTFRRTHTLKAPAGGSLVDACVLTRPSGGLCVAAAGEWAVCLWSLTAARDWTLTHTWAFNEPVINVFAVPGAADLLCVTLGQLEIREVRMLSCSSLAQVLLCEGLVLAVVAVPRSRVVTSSHSYVSTLQVFTLSDCGSTPSSQPLASPGVCVGALAPVDGLLDALIGTDESGRLFVWNLKTGQLLRTLTLTDGLSHTAVLRGYSYSGVLFVLLQHHLLSSLEEEERKAKEKDLMSPEDEEERKESALFSLVAVNPLSGKSVLVTQLHPPKSWSGRLCEADVSGSSVVGLSQSGCVCLWELQCRGASKMLWAPEGEGWTLVRWGGRDSLITGHLNGDVGLHCYRTSSSTLPN
ncbi:partner and localizer of BRCA2 isoform X3 [Xyrichtys novacula]|uniref:Partner and localizer of BRCA2 isoform X3 n=1 Tax=Xyrichtys novacula TaxID=13765 RepID=A0AAV1EZI7_XYRNO|nr:partner and localizer of BRCA2 isoform X3 [Xyrichtys novacula]